MFDRGKKYCQTQEPLVERTKSAYALIIHVQSSQPPDLSFCRPPCTEKCEGPSRSPNNILISQS